MPKLSFGQGIENKKFVRSLIIFVFQRISDRLFHRHGAARSGKCLKFCIAKFLLQNCCEPIQPTSISARQGKLPCLDLHFDCTDDLSSALEMLFRSSDACETYKAFDKQAI